MTRRDGALDLIDDGADAVSRAGTWVGVLWLTAVPARLLLVLVASRAIALGADAQEYGAYLRQLAYAALAAWVVSLYGRLVFVRACQAALQSGRSPGRAVLRVPLSQLVSYAAVAIVLEALFWVFFFTMGAPAVLLVAAGLAPAAVEPGGTPLDAAKATLASLRRPFRLVRLWLLFAVAAALAFVNLHLFVWAAVWLLNGLPGARLELLGHALSLSRPLYLLLLGAGVSLLLEPFWLSSLAAHVASLRAVSSGEDLRRWFEEVRQA